MRHIVPLFLLLMLPVLGLTGCQSESAPEGPEDSGADSVTLLTSIGGSGDNGYNDLVLGGAMRFYHNNGDVRFSMRRPRDIDEARAILDEWIAETASNTGRSLIILASDVYRQLVAGRELNLTERQRILLFENPEGAMPQGVSTFFIRRYGASCLSGMVAAESPEAHIIAANRSEGLLADAIAGFADGYRELSGNYAVIHYLADDESGFSMPNKGYEVAQGIDEAFIFPLAGGSNNGIYKYSREEEFTLQLVAGMDVDCSEYSTRVPFSLVVHIDRVICDILSQWYATGEIARHTDYTLADRDAVEVVANPLFFERVVAWLDYYSDDDYWQKRIDGFYGDALKMETSYYDK